MSCSLDILSSNKLEKALRFSSCSRVVVILPQTVSIERMLRDARTTTGFTARVATVAQTRRLLYEKSASETLTSRDECWSAGIATTPSRCTVKPGADRVGSPTSEWDQVIEKCQQARRRRMSRRLLGSWRRRGAEDDVGAAVGRQRRHDVSKLVDKTQRRRHPLWPIDAVFNLPHLYWGQGGCGWPRWNVAEIFSIRKLESLGYRMALFA